MADKEKAFLEKQDENFSPFLEDIHPLLANWGRLGRENFKYYEEADLEERFVENPTGSLLSAVKNDILLQRLPKQADREEDSLERESLKMQKSPSLSLHQAHSKMQEVEITFSMIRHYLDLGAEPSDFLVVAPDISKYAGLISLLSTDIPYEIHGVDLLSTNSAVQAFFSTFYNQRR